jgi:hypothetical protein
VHFLAAINPDSSGLILQLFLAAGLAAPFFMRDQIGRVVRNLRRGKHHDGAS